MARQGSSSDGHGHRSGSSNGSGQLTLTVASPAQRLKHASPSALQKGHARPLGGAAMATDLYTLSWRGQVLATTAAAKGLSRLGANGLDCGPVVSTDPSTGSSLVWSTLDSHKIVPQTTANGVYAMGLAAAIPSIPEPSWV